MLKCNGKEYRNLEEQVLKNQQDIQAFKDGTKTIAEFGIKVKGILATWDEENPPIAEDYGDAYLIGTSAPYDMRIWTRQEDTTGIWVDLGEFPNRGPQGLSATVQVGTTETTAPGTNAEVVNAGSESNAILNFKIPRGEKGNRGEKGEQGIQGPIGPQGIQGERGLTGPAFNVQGNLESEAQLPTPTKTMQELGYAFIIPSEGIDYIYVIIGNDTDGYLWQNIGASGIQGPQGEPGEGIEDLESVIDQGTPVVNYDTEDGIIINSTERYTYPSGQVDVETEREIPLIPGEGINIDADETNSKIIIDADVKKVNNKTGDVVLDATDIKLTTNQQTVQNNFIRVDEELNRIEEEITIISQDLSAQGFTPVVNTYYKYTGTTTTTFINGVIYFYDGTKYNTLNGKYIPKLNNPNLDYRVPANFNNEEGYLDVHQDLRPWNLILRDGNGRASVQEPLTYNQIANKGYVDNRIPFIIPPLPNIKGTYTLKCTVSNYGKIIEWVLEE